MTSGPSERWSGQSFPMWGSLASVVGRNKREMWAGRPEKEELFPSNMTWGSPARIAD